MSDGSERWVTHEYQCGVEVLVILLDIVRVVLSRLSFVNGIKILVGIVVPYWRQERSQSILDTRTAHSQQLLARVWSGN